MRLELCFVCYWFPTHYQLGTWILEVNTYMIYRCFKTRSIKKLTYNGLEIHNQRLISWVNRCKFRVRFLWCARRICDYYASGSLKLTIDAHLCITLLHSHQSQKHLEFAYSTWSEMSCNLHGLISLECNAICYQLYNYILICGGRKCTGRNLSSQSQCQMLPAFDNTIEWFIVKIIQAGHTQRNSPEWPEIDNRTPIQIIKGQKVSFQSSLKSLYFSLVDVEWKTVNFRPTPGLILERREWLL